MVFRSAWAVMVLAGLAFTAGSCGAYPDREFKSGDASVGAAGTAGGGGGSSGVGGASGASGSATGTGGGDASVVLVDAAKDSTLADVKADVDRQICKTPGAHPGLDCRCADGTVDDEFNRNLVGCADAPPRQHLGHAGTGVRHGLYGGHRDPVGVRSRARQLEATFQLLDRGRSPADQRHDVRRVRGQQAGESCERAVPRSADAHLRPVPDRRNSDRSRWRDVRSARLRFRDAGAQQLLWRVHHQPHRRHALLLPVS